MKIKTIEIQNFKGLKSVTVLNCGKVNALVGKNNSGKSSILHAIDMAGLAFSIGNWNQFQPKLEIKDLFNDVGAFSVKLHYFDDSAVSIQATPQYGPTFGPPPTPAQRYRSILIQPEVNSGSHQRRHKTPKDIVSYIENRNYNEISSLDILFAIKFYANLGQRGFSLSDYTSIIAEIKNYFPEIEDLESDRTENDIATLFYSELGKKLDIIYSGSGLKHFLDVLLKTIVSKADIILLDEPEHGLHPDLQRRFIAYLGKLADQKDVQFFMATHSPVLLNYADIVNYYRVTSVHGNRTVLSVPSEIVQTLLSDLGIRPSDVFNKDICVLVEGADDVVFFEHIVHKIYAKEFEGIAIGIIQYGGGAAEGIISGRIDIDNITPAQKYTLWIRDRDASPGEAPSENSTKFAHALERRRLDVHIWDKREIEFYYPIEVIRAAQQGDASKESAGINILNGNQNEKFDSLAKRDNVCVPSGKYLRRLLTEYLPDKSKLDPEIISLVEGKLLAWKREVLGE